MSITPRRALMSVSDKTGLVELASQLKTLNIEIIATGGTAATLRASQIEITEVSDYTGFPELMDGRVKTLHPKIHAGILARRERDSAILEEQNILPIDLVIVNLYPFQKTIESESCNLENVIENIDIGGPTLIRAAAKNFHDVLVVVDPSDYAKIIEELTKYRGKINDQTRWQFAQKAFAYTAQYEANIANYLGRLNPKTMHTTEYPKVFTQQWIKKQDLRYGENPHQTAAWYIERDREQGTLATAKSLQGKPLSFNNLVDADAALSCAKNFAVTTPACVIVKHANPCGVACADTQAKAYQRAFLTDPFSCFGGIIAFNQPLLGETARIIIDKQFVEVIVAPAISNEAKNILETKPNIRLLECGEWSSTLQQKYDYKKLNGAMLIQQSDPFITNKNDFKIVTQQRPTEKQLEDLLFAWHVVSYVKSNAIVFAKNNATIGIGAGQMSRVDSVKIAACKAKEADLNTEEAVLASDAFFPFPDSIEIAEQLGIRAIIQPGGSKRDEDIIAAANNAGIAMIFTGTRHFRH